MEPFRGLPAWTNQVGSSAASTDVDVATEQGVGRVAIVGRGRLGSALFQALQTEGVAVTGPHGRGYRGCIEQPEAIVILCVPDSQIAIAAQHIVPGPLLAHCSGATGLDTLGPRRAFSIHPVMTFPPDSEPGVFRGVAAAVSATDPDALRIAQLLAGRIGLQPFQVAEVDRVTYHAATAFAANFLVTVEAAAGELARTAGVDPGVLLPLARAALENWGRLGDAALTGPVARGDHAVVQAHRAAVADRTPHLTQLFDALVADTGRLAHSGRTAARGDLS